MTLDSSDILIAVAGLATLMVILVVVKFRQVKHQQFDWEDEEAIRPPAANEIAAPARMQPGRDDGEITIIFRRSGKQFSWDPASESLLAFAESRGIGVDSFCGEGRCGTCQTLLVDGDVEYSREPRVNVDQDHCLLCISMPKSDLILEI